MKLQCQTATQKPILQCHKKLFLHTKRSSVNNLGKLAHRSVQNTELQSPILKIIHTWNLHLRKPIFCQNFSCKNSTQKGNALQSKNTYHVIAMPNLCHTKNCNTTKKPLKNYQEFKSNTEKVQRSNSKPADISKNLCTYRASQHSAYKNQRLKMQARHFYQNL